MDTGQCITNMMNCKQGEHCLFRSFGLGVEVDRMGKLRRADITTAMSKWYPQVSTVNIQSNGNGVYDVTVTGDV
jgi:hypothetical protein